MKSEPPPPVQDIEPAVQTNESKLLMHGLNRLLNAHTMASKIRLDKVLLNIQLVAFALSWFGLVS